MLMNSREDQVNLQETLLRDPIQYLIVTATKKKFHPLDHQSQIML